MSWYYVGPDANPVGPISREELQSRRDSGAVSPETYVIEAPPGSAPKEWRRYRELFPATPLASALPPLPTGMPPSPPVATMGIPHPLFPSAPPQAPSPGGPVFTGTHPATYRLPPSHTNAWCSWALGLGIASLPLAFCGIGALLAIAGSVTGIVGMIQVGHHREQQGRGMAITGIILSVLSLIVVTAMAFAVMAGSMRNALQMTTEQTANDSDTR
jgi:hypothetical protein